MTRAEKKNVATTIEHVGSSYNRGRGETKPRGPGGKGGPGH